MLKRRRSSLGFSLVELMVVIAIVTMFLMAGAPSFSTWMQNARLRSSAESIVSGLQYARSEAVSRNARVRFQLVSSLDSGCAQSTSSPIWIVNLDPDAVDNEVDGRCDAAPSQTVMPRILQKRESLSAASNMVVSTGGISTLVFNGLGRITPVPAGTVNINVTSSVSGACAADGGSLTCLRIVVSPAGQVRMCNPKFAQTTDPQGC